MTQFHINYLYPPLIGPEIFAHRLRGALEGRGWKFRDYYPGGNGFDEEFINLAIIEGPYVRGAKNILRLDGLYFDSENQLTDKLNSPIFSCYDSFDAVIFQSEFSKKMYEAFRGERTPNFIIPNGVPEYFSPYTRENPYMHYLRSKYSKVCIASATWRRHKRLEEVIEAFRDKSLEHVALVVLGGEDYKLSVKSLPPNVIMHENVKPQSLPPMYVAADAMIHLAWLDWCPNTVVEALACGVPVLCSHNGGTKELVKDNGVVVQLEETYKIGERVPLYNPPKVDTKQIVAGILEVLEHKTGFERPDLSIESVADNYISATQSIDKSEGA